MSIIRGNLLVFGFALLSSSLTAFAQPHSAGSGKREEAIERVEQKHEAANRESKKRFDAQAKRDAELKKAQEQSLKQQEKERKKQAELLKDIEKSRHEEESKKP